MIVSALLGGLATVIMLEDILREITKDIPRPFGIFLSGGLDSGILASLLKPDFAITVNFEGEFYDELKYAHAICQDLNIKHFIIQPNKDEFNEVMVESMKILGKPVNSVSVFPWYIAMSAAKDLGAQTMIGGEGSDEIFGGYTRYLILKKIYELYSMESIKGYHPMLDSIFGSLVDTHSRLVGVSRETLFKRYEEKKGFLNQIGWAEYTESLPPIIEMEKKFAEHFGINLILPFTHKRVVEYGFSLDDDEKIDMANEIRKKPVYDIAKKYLPEKVWQRKDKKGFVSPANEWCGSQNKYDKKEYLRLQEDILSNL